MGGSLLWDACSQKIPKYILREAEEGEKKPHTQQKTNKQKKGGTGKSDSLAAVRRRRAGFKQQFYTFFFFFWFADPWVANCHLVPVRWEAPEQQPSSLQGPGDICCRMRVCWRLLDSSAPRWGPVGMSTRRWQCQQAEGWMLGSGNGSRRWEHGDQEVFGKGGWGRKAQAGWGKRSRVCSMWRCSTKLVLDFRKHHMLTINLCVLGWKRMKMSSGDPKKKKNNNLWEQSCI